MTKKPGTLMAVAVVVAVLAITGGRVGLRLAESPNPCGTLTGSLAGLADALGAFDGTVTAIAHNAGGSENEIRRARDCGATVIELDVVSVDGELMVSHEKPTPAEEPSTQPLDALWPIATEAMAVTLDIKSASPGIAGQVAAFLAKHPAPKTGEVAVSSKELDVLAAMRQQAPGVRRFLSLETEQGLAAFRSDDEAQRVVHGVTIEESLIDREVVAWLDRRGLLTWAWTVDNPVRADDLVALGVDGIITDNLALLDALPTEASPGTQSNGQVSRSAVWPPLRPGASHARRRRARPSGSRP